ncbi:MAG: Dna2/Cas4 domain-containing protein [Chloroflexi bacterium]|nr:MAG: Dna2/Cas4 domain-containing protein [Chloroflexota bacterium]
MNNLFFILPILLLIAVALWRLAGNWQQQTGLPDGEVIYTDSGAWFSNDQPLYASQYRLVGKPDYLVEQADGMIIPVELKSGHAPAKPWEGHVLQLAAYCLLVQENFGIRPDYGIIQYQDRAFAIEFTPELEEDLLDILAEMHEDMFAGEIHRDHDQWRLCASCGVRHVCTQRLD